MDSRVLASKQESVSQTSLEVHEYKPQGMDDVDQWCPTFLACDPLKVKSNIGPPLYIVMKEGLKRQNAVVYNK